MGTRASERRDSTPPARRRRGTHVFRRRIRLPKWGRASFNEDTSRRDDRACEVSSLNDARPHLLSPRHVAIQRGPRNPPRGPDLLAFQLARLENRNTAGLPTPSRLPPAAG